MCQLILGEKFPDLADNPLVLVILMLVTSPSVKDCIHIIDLVMARATAHQEIKIMEAIFFLLSHLVVFKERFMLPEKIVYILRHSIHLYYNQTSLGSRELTSEQRRIVNMDMKSLLGTTDTVRINAYAGTGKTTTLVELCKANPTVRFLLVVFNKSVEIHSNKVFPTNVIAKTANAISYKYIKSEAGGMFANWNLKYSDIIDRVDRKGISPFNKFHWAAMTLETLNAFCHSGDEFITIKHPPSVWNVGSERKFLDLNCTSWLVKDAKKVWNLVLKDSVKSIKYDHTTSMKKFQLSKPDLQYWVGPHDVILLDEAQDMNPCMMSICLQQKVPKIVIGDSFQQIYTFRGAVDALKRVEKSNLTKIRGTFYLTQSFRFGPEIAFAANSVLTHYLNNKGPTLFGSRKKDSVLGEESLAAADGPIVILARTNLRLFTEMVTLVCEPEEHLRPKIAFPFDPTSRDPMGWEKLTNMVHHKTGNIQLIAGKTKYAPVFKKTWEEFKHQTDCAKDNETLGKINIVEMYGSSIIEYINIMKNQSQSDMDATGVKYVFSTVHKFKGLEMNHVRLLEDFNFAGVPYSKFDPNTFKGKEKDEMNLLYVALTRAKKSLTMNSALFFHFTSKHIGENFQSLKMAPECLVQCIRCEEKTPSMSRLCFFLDRVKIGTQYTRKEGYLCSKCSVLDNRRIHGSVEDKEVSPGDVPDTFRLFSRCLIKTSVFDSDTMDAHEERVRLHEENLRLFFDKDQRDQMIVRGHNLYCASDEDSCNKIEEEWEDDGQNMMLFKIEEEWKDDGQDMMLLEVINGEYPEEF